MKKKGFTLIELLVAGFLGAIVIGLVAIGLRSFVKGRESGFTKGDLETQITALGQLILTVGRGAKDCTSPSSTALNCNVDFNVPPTGALSAVSFSQTTVSGQTVIQYIRPGNNPQYYPELGTDGNITDFVICDCQDMKTGGPPTNCAIEPVNVSTRWAATMSNCSSAAVDRYFRFRIRAKSTSFKAQDFQTHFQSAIYVRNPSIVTDLVYQWGGGD